MKDIRGKVRVIAQDSLYREDELHQPTTKENLPKDTVVVNGIMATFGFHPGRLEAHRQEVREILLEMDESFRVSKGGGWSFLNLAFDKTGEQWGEHDDMELLCVLAIGLKLGKWLTPRELWNVLPGGMPYVGFEI